MNEKKCSVTNYVTINGGNNIIGCCNPDHINGSNDCNAPYNFNNPLDSVGALHNILFKEIILYSDNKKIPKSGIDVVTRSVENSIYIFELNNLKVKDKDNLLGMVVRAVDDVDNYFLNFIQNIGLSQEYVNLISELIKKIIELDEKGIDEYCSFKRLIIGYEDKILEKFSLQDKEQVGMLCFFSVLRFSLFLKDSDLYAYNITTKAAKGVFRNICVNIGDAIGAIGGAIPHLKEDLDSILEHATEGAATVSNAIRDIFDTNK